MGCNYYKMFPQFREHLKKKGITGDINQEEFAREVMRWYGFSDDTAWKWMKCFEKVGLIRLRQHIDECSGASCGWSVDFV